MTKKVKEETKEDVFIKEYTELCNKHGRKIIAETRLTVSETTKDEIKTA